MPIDADRDDLPFGGPGIRRTVADDLSIGGLLVWNQTQDDEGGRLVMLTGQTCDEERRVIHNGTWLVSCGAGGRGSDLCLLWLLPNDAKVLGYRGD